MASVSSPSDNSSIIGYDNKIRSGHDPTIPDVLFYFGAGSLGTLFNSLVLIIASKYVNSDDKPRQILVFNMTIADLLFSIVCVLPRPITHYIGTRYLSVLVPYLCQPYYTIIWSVQLSSPLFLVWLNVDKFIAIQDPLHYTIFVDRNRVLKISLLSWVPICVLTFALSSFMKLPDGCKHISRSGGAYIPICVLLGLMILASFITSTIIYIVVEKSSRADQRHRSVVYKRLLFIFSSTLWTFFTCFPYHVIYSINMLCEGCRTSVFKEARRFFHRVFIVGTMINPVITIWTQRTYRLGLMKLLGKKKPIFTTTQTTNKRWHGASLNDERRAESTAL